MNILSGDVPEGKTRGRGLFRVSISLCRVVFIRITEIRVEETGQGGSTANVQNMLKQ